MPFFNGVEGCTMATHTYAIEGGSFVLLASHTQSEKGLIASGLIKENEAPQAGVVELPDDMCHTAVTGGRFSQVIAHGRTLVKASSRSFEGLIYAELDFNEICLAKNIVDPVGQYSRPDIFSLQINSNVNRQGVYKETTSEFAHASRHPELSLESVLEPFPVANGKLEKLTNGTAEKQSNA